MQDEIRTLPQKLLMGRRALVTGAGRGIGREIARQMALEGADVIINARKEPELLTLREEITAMGQKCQIVLGDICTPETAEKILRNLKREHQISDVAGGYYLALDGLCKPDQRTILAVWVLLRFIDYVDPMAHYPAVYPSQIFFLKENTGYEIVVLYDGEQHLSKLLQPQDDEMKYIFVLPNIAMASQMMLPKAPCLFATVNFAGQEEPDITFYTEEAATDGLDKLVHSSAG